MKKFLFSVIAALSLPCLLFGQNAAPAPTPAPKPAPAKADAAPPVPASPTPTAETAAVQEKATLALMPFIIDESLQISINNQVLVPRMIETEFSAHLMDFLSKSRKFNLLERDYLRKIMNENKLTESDYAKPGEYQKIGKLLVADYLLIGHIDRLTFLIKEQNIELTGEKSRDITATLKIDFRIVEVKSGKIVFTYIAPDKVKSEDIRREVPYSERKDWTLDDYRDRLFTYVAAKAGNAVLEGIYPVKIASLQGDSVVLNRGEGAGPMLGKKYDVFSQGKPVLDPDTKEIIGTEENKVGSIEVSEVLPKFSKAKITSTEGTIQPGAICRPVQPAATAAPASGAPDPLRATPGW
ncbi:MAG: hypothetical protein A2X49_04470 [Lentisphaerae bacterium GWF2_52_8]|nr:MAG: hypothetical protein A2X49_04470 [Lentisphaerae bacterium GWF2_52_8]